MFFHGKLKLIPSEIITVALHLCNHKSCLCFDKVKLPLKEHDIQLHVFYLIFYVRGTELYEPEVLERTLKLQDW